MQIKIYGQKRTGTNMLQHLLKEAGQTVMVNTGGWKHGPPRLIGDRQLIIGKLERNWVDSIERYNQPGGEERHYAEDWEAREFAYLDFCRKHKTAMYIQYEGLVGSPDMWWKLICKHCNIRHPFPGLPTNYMGRSGLETEYKYQPGFNLPGIHKGA